MKDRICVYCMLSASDRKLNLWTIGVRIRFHNTQRMYKNEKCCSILVVCPQLLFCTNDRASVHLSVCVHCTVHMFVRYENRMYAVDAPVCVHKSKADTEHGFDKLYPKHGCQRFPSGGHYNKLLSSSTWMRSSVCLSTKNRYLSSTLKNRHVQFVQRKSFW